MLLNGEDKPYIVTFDPLDGSSIIGSNFTVGTIFGVWVNCDKKVIFIKIIYILNYKYLYI